MKYKMVVESDDYQKALSLYRAVVRQKTFKQNLPGKRGSACSITTVGDVNHFATHNEECPLCERTYGVPQVRFARRYEPQIDSKQITMAVLKELKHDAAIPAEMSAHASYLLQFLEDNEVMEND